MNITIVGIGYVGVSVAILLSQKHNVTALDISKERVKMLNNKQCPIKDDLAQKYLETKKLNLRATLDEDEAYKTADIIILALPTIKEIGQTVKRIKSYHQNGRKPLIVIKSTVGIGDTALVRLSTGYNDIIFSPEFLREGNGLYDNLNPSRIIVGACVDQMKSAKEFAQLLKDCADTDPPILLMKTKEAEAVKLFSNTYLAQRVAFFNEIDTFAAIKNLDTKSIIDGVCLDPRIGNFYNNPSFGYGGYCLPKDTGILQGATADTPNVLVDATIKSNVARKAFIVRDILGRVKKGATIGIYRLVMKQGSDNFRSSAVMDIIDELKKAGAKLIIYEPTVSSMNGVEIIQSLDEFIACADLIIANRVSPEIKCCAKLYTRDIFCEN